MAVKVIVALFRLADGDLPERLGHASSLDVAR